MGSTRETPRASQNPELQLKTLNRGILSTVASTFSQDPDLSDVESSRATPRYAQGSRTARGPRERVQPASRAEYEAAKRRKEHAARHASLLKLREEDERQLQERRAKTVQLRESRFEAKMDELQKGDVLRVEASELILGHDTKCERKRVELYDAWDSEVSKRVEMQLSKFMSPKVEEEPNGFRAELKVSDHPGMRDIRDQQSEQRFHRYANVILQPSPRGEVKDQVRMRAAAAELEASRSHARPTLPVEQWGQQHHYSSVNGYFAQGCERGGEFHSQRRMGTNAHIIDESDGVTAHGKTKNRYEKHMLGLLEGTAAKEGEAARHKRSHGAGSGAPCQDHFYYEQGIPIVDAEFPVGKKMFYHLHS